MAVARRIDVWLRGGWAMDFFLGEVSRDHADVDWFAWARDAAVIRSALVGAGWQQVGDAPVQQQLDVIRNDHEMSFGWLARDDADQVVVAGGPWAGEPWPAGMLDGVLARIGEVSCRVINPSAQIEIKQMMPVWVPGRPRRAKDAQDVARLTAALRGHRDSPA